jgi:hypothetical protein
VENFIFEGDDAEGVGRAGAKPITRRGEQFFYTTLTQRRAINKRCAAHIIIGFLTGCFYCDFFYCS